MGTLKWQGPSTWNDPLFTVALFQKMSIEWDGRDIVQLFSTLYGADYKLVFNAPDSLAVEAFEGIKFVYDSPIDWDKIPVPVSLTVGGKVLEVPKQIGQLSFGQLVMLRQRIDKLRNDETIDGRLIGFAAALYFYFQYYPEDKRMDQKKLDALECMILGKQILEVYPISFFLLSRLWQSGNRSGQLWTNLLAWLNRLTQTLKPMKTTMSLQT